MSSIGYCFDYQEAISAYNRLSAEQKDRFFPGKESQAKKAIGSMVYLLGESSSIDVLSEVYLSIASRLQLGFSNERIQQTILMRYSSIIAPEIAAAVINCIGKVSKNFSHLQKDRRQEDLSINSQFDTQYRQRFAENKRKKDDAITLAGFGVNPENPIYAHGASSSYDYLNKLYSADSIPLIWDRIGSTSTDLSEDIIDAYELCLPDGTHYCTVYINMYSKVTSDYCPKGLYSFELKQIPDGEKLITHNTEKCFKESVDAGKIKKTAANTITTDTIEVSTQPSGSVAIPSSNNSSALRDTDQEELNDTRREDVASDHESLDSKELAFYCKRCGGYVDKSSRKCSQCGKQYFRIRRFIALLVVGIVIVALSAMNGYLYYQHYNSVDRIKMLELELSEKDRYISDLIQKVSDKDSKISNLQNEVSRLTKRADSYDDICEAARKGNLGYASSNFRASESLIVVKKNQTNRKFTLTTNWSGSGTVSVSYSDSYPSAWVDFDNDSWQTSTTMTINPHYVGVSVVTFSNSLDNEEFSIIIVVTE